MKIPMQNYNIRYIVEDNNISIVTQKIVIMKRLELSVILFLINKWTCK